MSRLKSLPMAPLMSTLKLTQTLCTMSMVNGQCTCRDYDKAPNGLCKHRIYGMLITRSFQTYQPTTTVSLPEAPASVNVHVQIDGRQVQVTLRDTNESRLLERLAKVLQQYPLSQSGSENISLPNPMAGHRALPSWCKVHDVLMKLNTKDGKSWYSHYLKDERRYCQGK